MIDVQQRVAFTQLEQENIALLDKLRALEAERDHWRNKYELLRARIKRHVDGILAAFIQEEAEGQKGENV